MTTKKTTHVMSIFNTKDAPPFRMCYGELLALKYFRRAINHYACKRIDTDFFGPLVRNIADERCVFAFRDGLLKKRKADLKKEYTNPFVQSDGVRGLLADIWNKPEYRTICRRQLVAWADELIAEYEERSKDDPLRKRLADLKTLLRLSEAEMSVLIGYWLLGTDKIETVAVPFAVGPVSGFLALATGLGEQEVRAAAARGSRLRRFGCLCGERNSTLIHSRICNYLEGVSREPLASSFYSRDEGEALPAAFFGKLAETHLPILKRMLEGSHGRKLNILLYGAPGTGKTSFARVLAKESGRIAYQVRQRPKNVDGDYHSASAEIRYAAIEICNGQTNPDESIIVVDEADALLRCRTDFRLFGADDEAVGDKGLLNDILEHIETPTIWISNTRADELDSSSRRRFDYAIRFERLSADQRLEAWRNAATKAGAAELISDATIAACAKEYPVSTGVAAQAFANLKRVEAKREEAEELFRQFLARQAELLGVTAEESRFLQPARDYSLEGLNIRSGIPLAKIERAVRRFLDGGFVRNDRDAPRMNILLTGAPGSGKTEFVKYLAQAVGRPLLMRRPSDLKSKYVGETEQNIAAAFREAKDRRAILFFDEVDTFMDDRDKLDLGHEKSFVNEVLQQMEGFGGLFIGTTNFKDKLDPAVARRFTYKIELAPLDETGRRHFWKRFFGESISEEGGHKLDALEGLTPGDFRTVRQELYYLGDEACEADRLKALESELASKPFAPRRIGFSCCTE